MDSNAKIFVAGHKGLVGSALCRQLKKQGYDNVLTATHAKLDLTNQKKVNDWFALNRPNYVFLAAAKVGGIGANSAYPADFIRDNLLIQSNVIEAAYTNYVKKLCFFGSACIYPKLAPVPIKEDCLLTAPLEETNMAYAIAKIAGLTMCQKYTEQYGMDTISLMPANLYGIHDNFHVNDGHVIPSLINKFYSAKINNQDTVTLFGDGSPIREFLYIDDLANAAVFLMKNYDDPSIINVGSPYHTTIKNVADIISKEIGYNGKIFWDTTKPNGTPKRFLDISKISSLGWTPQISFEEGIKRTIDWFIVNNKSVRK